MWRGHIRLKLRLVQQREVLHEHKLGRGHEHSGSDANVVRVQ